MGVERPQVTGPLVIGLENEDTALSNKTTIYFTPGHAGLENVTTWKRMYSESNDIRLKNGNRAEGKAVAGPSCDINEENFLVG